MVDAVDIHGAHELTVALARRLLGSFQGGEESVMISLGHRCRRFGPRRVDCEVRSYEDSAPPVDKCDLMASIRLRARGIVLRRDYACGNPRQGVFRRRPHWRKEPDVPDVRALSPDNGGLPS